MREISTRKYASVIGSKVSSNRSNDDLLEFTKDVLQEYGSPVVDELAEECLNRVFSLDAKNFYKEYEMAEYAFTDVMVKWFGESVNIAYDDYFSGEMIDVSDDGFESFRETTGAECEAPEIYVPGGGVECSQFCGYSECY